MNRATHDESGFTLIEVLISLVIFSFGALAALALSLFVMNGNKDAQSMTEATSAGRIEMERILGLTGTTVPPLDTCATQLTSFSTDGNCWRQVRPSPNGMLLQVENYRKRVGNTVRVEVTVHYPLNRERRALKEGDAGWIDCIAERTAGRTTCRRQIFYGQKGNFQ